MVDMWLANKFFSRIKGGARVILVGDPDQLPSVGAGNVFRELIDCGLITVTVLDQIFRQSKDSLIAYNAKFINEGNTKLYYGQDFVFMASNNQAEAAERIVARYCREIEESGIDRVQILSPFRSDGAASAEQLNEAIREVVNPFRSAEEEIKIGVKVFRVNDRIMQTKNTAKVSNGDLGFIRYIKNDEDGTRVGLDFGVGRELEYGIEDMVNLDLAYATTIHKAMGSEYDTVIMPLLKAHTVMLYRNLLYDQVAFVSQDNYLFDESIRENIRMGRPAATDAEVEAVAKAAGCDAFIRGLERGYDTVVGGGGAHLSGGERQRIAIARAMLKDAPIVVLDEATAYIDPENEAVVQQAVGKLVAGKTVLVIAHRLSTITGADQIVVVNGGRIQDAGTHEELLKNCPLYQEMWRAHMGAKEGEQA